MYSRMGADRGEGAGRVGGALCRTGRRALCEQVYGRGCSYWYRGAAGGAVLGPAELRRISWALYFCSQTRAAGRNRPARSHLAGSKGAWALHK